MGHPIRHLAARPPLRRFDADRLPGPSTASTPPSPSDSAAPPNEAGRVWVGTPLRVVRRLDRATVDLRNSLTYDGLLVSDRDLALSGS